MTEPDQFAKLFADREGTYLLSHSVGLAVHGTREAVGGALDIWEHDTAAVWPQWLGIINGFRTSLADLLGADVSSICPQSNVSSGLTKILGALRKTFDAQQPVVLLTEDAFPSVGYVCQHAGYDVRFIGVDEDALDPATWQRHLAHVDVAIVTQVHSNTGELLPVDAIAEVARAAGALSGFRTTTRSSSTSTSSVTPAMHSGFGAEPQRSCHTPQPATRLMCSQRSA